MLSNRFKRLLKGLSMTTGWILIGFLLSMGLAEFQGELEVRVGEKEGYLKVKGPSGQCQLIDADRFENPK